MAGVKKICKVCGKEYMSCQTTTRNLGAFRYKDVVCSPECFTVWVERVEASRKPANQILEEVLDETPDIETIVDEPSDAVMTEEEEIELEIDC